MQKLNIPTILVLNMEDELLLNGGKIDVDYLKKEFEIIVILTFAIGIMEMTGYMARAIFLMDSLFSKVGLNGKVFMPLLTGHACAIPGIISVRTLVLFGAYLMGSLIGIVLSGIAKLCYLTVRGNNPTLLDRVAEIPSYKLPTIQAVLFRRVITIHCFVFFRLLFL